MRVLISLRSSGFPTTSCGSPDAVVGAYLEPICEMLSLGGHSVVVEDPEGLLDGARFIRCCSVVRGPLGLVSLNLPHLVAHSDGVMFLGYPAMWGAEKGAAPMEGRAFIRAVTLNGRQVGPLGLEIFICSSLSTPVLLVAGDDFVCFEAEALFDNIRPVTCELKESLGTSSFVALQGGVEVLMDGVRSSLWAWDSGRIPIPNPLEVPYRVVLDLAGPGLADIASLVPMSRRVGACQVSFESEDLFEIRRFLACASAMLNGPWEV